jgi:hypothetical protein
MPDRSRIPKDIKDFLPYLQRTDNYQKATDIATGNPRYLNWKWTAADSAKWTEVRNKVDKENKTYREIYQRNKHSATAILLLRKELMKYNRDKKLLSKISGTQLPPAVLADFEVFRIKQGTPLEQKRSYDEADLTPPIVSVRRLEHLTHYLRVRNPSHSGWGKGKKISVIQIWRAIVEADAREPKESDYHFIGYVKHGSFKAEFTQKDNRKDAWYKSRKVSTRGTWGRFSVALKVPVI